MPGYETSWYPYVTAFQIAGTTLVAHTDLYPDAEGRQFAQGPCSALSVLVFSARQGMGLTGLRILGQGGKVLVERRTVADKC